MTDRPVPPGELERACRLLAEAGRVLFLTGAGVSAESGVPTFRGEGGLWRDHRPEELATPEAFRRDPRLVWEWYAWRQGVVSACDPNPAHRVIARMVRARPGTRVVTQNVDGLHERAAREVSGGAGLAREERPVELHGSLFRIRCSACPHRSHLADGSPVDASSERTLPRCPDCDALLRPDVVWFGEVLDAGVLGEATELAGAADVCVVAGTSALVHPAASLPLLTLRSGGTLIEVNPAPTPLSRDCEVVLEGRAGLILPVLEAER